MIGNISKSKAQKGDALTFDMLTEAEKASLSPKPDWNQTDETKADFIKNKPIVDNEVSVFSTNAVSNAAVTEYIESRHRNLTEGKEIAGKAWSDGKGNEIHTTYATKEELNTRLGQGFADYVEQNFATKEELNTTKELCEQTINKASVIDEAYADNEYYPSTLAVKNFVEFQIGDIETALENIITKYGLGGDSV